MFFIQFCLLVCLCYTLTWKVYIYIYRTCLSCGKKEKLTKRTNIIKKPLQPWKW